jgi:tetratricopeptide (TPR) repeat protein
MFTISSNVYESSLESRYELSDLARDYLSKHHPVSPQVEAKFKKRQRQLIAAIEAMNAEQVDDPYSFYNIARSTQSHTIVAAYLREALLKAKSKAFKEADDIVSKAHDLDPGYFEVYRVEASIKAQQENYSAARTAYETAIELNPNHAPLLYWFAGFLLRYQNDLEEAYNAFKRAENLDPDGLEIQSEIARTCLYLHRFEEAKIIIDKLIRTPRKIKSQMRRKIYDLHLQYYRRKADHLIYQKDRINAFKELEHLRDVYEKCPSELIDLKMMETLRKIEGPLRTCAKLVMQQNEEGKKRAENLVKWFESNVISSQEIPGNINRSINDRLSGIVSSLFTERKYGFIRANDGRIFYFHESDMPKSGDWQKLEERAGVVFWDGGVKSGQRPHAIDVMLRN